METPQRPRTIGKGLARTQALVILAVLAAIGSALWQLGSFESGARSLESKESRKSSALLQARHEKCSGFRVSDATLLPNSVVEPRRHGFRGGHSDS